MLWSIKPNIKAPINIKHQDIKFFLILRFINSKDRINESMYANKDVKIEFGNKNINNIGSTFNREYIYIKDFFLFND